MHEIRQEDVLKLKKIFESSRRAVFFGGAGVSTESGIPDFRSEDGLYRQSSSIRPKRSCRIPFFCGIQKNFSIFIGKRCCFWTRGPTRRTIRLRRSKARGNLRASSPKISTGCTKKRAAKPCSNCTEACTATIARRAAWDIPFRRS